MDQLEEVLLPSLQKLSSEYKVPFGTTKKYNKFANISNEETKKILKEIRNKWQPKESDARSSSMSLSTDGIDDPQIIDKCDGLERELTMKLMRILQKEIEILKKEMKSQSLVQFGILIYHLEMQIIVEEKDMMYGVLNSMKDALEIIGMFHFGGINSQKMKNL